MLKGTVTPFFDRVVPNVTAAPPGAGRAAAAAE